MIRGLGHLELMDVEDRAARLQKRSIKTAAMQQGIRLAVSTLDLVALEGADTAGKARHVYAEAVSPPPRIAECQSIAAVRVCPSLAAARKALKGTGVRAASVA